VVESSCLVTGVTDGDVTKLVKTNANFDFEIHQMRIEAFILSVGM